MKLDLSELYERTRALYEEPGRAGERYGCDCGCGGDDPEMWERGSAEAADARAWFAQHGIEVVDAAA